MPTYYKRNGIRISVWFSGYEIDLRPFLADARAEHLARHLLGFRDCALVEYECQMQITEYATEKARQFDSNPNFPLCTLADLQVP